MELCLRVWAGMRGPGNYSTARWKSPKWRAAWEGGGARRLGEFEGLARQTPAHELSRNYESAVSLLRNSQEPATTKRLIRCALKLVDILTVPEPAEPELDDISWEGFSFKREVLKIEKTFIERALRDAG